MDLPSIWNLDSVKTIELREKGVWVVFDMRIVFLEDFPEEFVLGMMDGLDDVFIISGEVEETPTLPRRAQFG
jgi:hypothetical protein